MLVSRSLVCGANNISNWDAQMSIYDKAGGNVELLRIVTLAPRI